MVVRRCCHCLVFGKQHHCGSSYLSGGGGFKLCRQHGSKNGYGVLYAIGKKQRIMEKIYLALNGWTKKNKAVDYICIIMIVSNISSIYQHHNNPTKDRTIAQHPRCVCMYVYTYVCMYMCPVGWTLLFSVFFWGGGGVGYCLRRRLLCSSFFFWCLFLNVWEAFFSLFCFFFFCVAGVLEKDFVRTGEVPTHDYYGTNGNECRQELGVLSHQDYQTAFLLLLIDWNVRCCHGRSREIRDPEVNEGYLFLRLIGSNREMYGGRSPSRQCS